MSDRRLIMEESSVTPDFSKMQGARVRGKPRQLLREPHPYAHGMLAMGIRGLDAGAVVLGSLLVWWFCAVRSGSSSPRLFLLPVCAAAVIFCLFPKKSKLLSFPKVRRFKAQVRYLLTPLFAGFLACACVWAIVAHGPVAGLYLALLWVCVVLPVVTVERAILTFFLHQPAVVRKLRRKIAIVGNGVVAEALATRLLNDAGQSYSVFGVFDDRLAGENPSSEKDLDGLIRRSRREALHAVILAFPETEDSERRVREAACSLRPVLADIYATPSLASGFDRFLPCEFFGDTTLFVVQRRPLSDVQIFEKTLFDLVSSFCVLIFLAPFLCLVALMIKLDSPGPVFFCQPRIGKNGKTILVYKFRSMYTHMSDLMAEQQTSRGDPRVTRIGKWLRRLSIDEVPQLFNVLKGEMSMVGPRPHAPHTRAGGMLLDDAVAEYVLRYHVKPGITGWAQINGARGELVTVADLQKRVAYDLDYIRRWSLLFDLKIMFLTIIREIFSRHAF